MKKHNNILILSLIITTIALLLVLEGFWLRASYLGEYDQLRREVNLIFRSTLFTMQDSIIQKSIRPLESDSGALRIIRRDTFHDTVNFVAGDQVYKRRSSQVTSDNIQIYISAPPGKDSLKSTFFRPLASRIKSDAGQRAFAMKLGVDTLKVEEITKKFRRALTESGIDLPFEVRSLAPAQAPTGKTSTLATEWLPTINSSRYSAAFSDAPASIARKIAPQILFSVFLSSLTILSFIFMYRSIRAQQRLVEIKNDFISNVTHELKTPIATVSVVLEALKNFKGIDNPQLTSEYLDIAQYELGRLSLLTDKVLTTSLFDEKGVKYETETVDLEKTVNDILRSMKLLFAKRDADVGLEKEGSSFTLTGSAVHLTNVVYNLVDNALKYSVSQPRIVIHLADLGDRVSLSVRDNGIGIPEEYHPKVFDKFFRVPTGDVHTVKGHGLGLNYVRNVVVAHGGQITLASKPGKGSNFVITLPRNPA